jgi:hypothetical protein
MNKLLSFNYINIIDVHLMLWGDKSLSEAQNTEIFKIIHLFLNACGHFSQNK